MVYLDNAATTTMSDIALKELTEISANNYGNPSSIYKLGRSSKKLLDEAREIIAECIGAEPGEIFFTSCGTESDNWVLREIGPKLKKVVTSNIEHHAVLYPAQELQALGVSVEFLPVNDQCQITKQSLVDSLDGTPALVSIMFQNNETGTIQNIKELAEAVHKSNEKSIFHTDAVQAVGHTRINVKELGIDMLSASAHKFNGPKGVGFLYISKSCRMDPFILGGGQERGLRSGTENVAGICSMAKALEENVAQIDNLHSHILDLEEKLIDALTDAGIEFSINGDNNQRATGVLNISFKGLDGEGLLNMLDMHDIYISIGSACNSKSQDRSHVLKAMGLSDEVIDSSVRISIGRYNTENDIDLLVKQIKKYHSVSLMAET